MLWAAAQTELFFFVCTSNLTGGLLYVEQWDASRKALS